MNAPTAQTTVVASLNNNNDSAPIQDVIAVTPQGESPWLILALIVQSVIILGAVFMFVRGLRKR